MGEMMKKTLNQNLTSTLNLKGQTTVPLAIRKALNMDTGAQLRWSFNPNGSINVRVKTGSYKILRGMLTPPNGVHLSVEELSV